MYASLAEMDEHPNVPLPEPVNPLDSSDFFYEPSAAMPMDLDDLFSAQPLGNRELQQDTIFDSDPTQIGWSDIFAIPPTASLDNEFVHSNILISSHRLILNTRLDWNLYLNQIPDMVKGI